MAKGGQRFAPVVRQDHGVTGGLQVIAHEVRDLGFVVYYQDRLAHVNPSFLIRSQCYLILEFLSIALRIHNFFKISLLFFHICALQ